MMDRTESSEIVLARSRRRFRIALAVFLVWVAALTVTAMLSSYRPAPRPTPIAPADEAATRP